MSAGVQEHSGEVYLPRHQVLTGEGRRKKKVIVVKRNANSVSNIGKGKYTPLIIV